MTSYVYLNLNTTSVENQKRVKKYAGEAQLVEDAQSEKMHWSNRKLGELLKSLKSGDIILAYDASDLCCSTTQILEIFSIASRNEVDIGFLKYGLSTKNERPLTDKVNILQLLSAIESDFVSRRTVEALARRKQAGLPLGRPKGRLNKSLKLDQFKDEIDKYLNLGVSKASISKIIACHPQTLYDWLSRRDTRQGL